MVNVMNKKSLPIIAEGDDRDRHYYLNLPWTYTVELDKDNEGKKIYIISVNELPGIKTHAYTIDEAMEGIKEPMEAMFELYMEMGKEIPEPCDLARE